MSALAHSPRARAPPRGGRPPPSARSPPRPLRPASGLGPAGRCRGYVTGACALWAPAAACADSYRLSVPVVLGDGAGPGRCREAPTAAGPLEKPRCHRRERTKRKGRGKVKAKTKAKTRRRSKEKPPWGPCSLGLPSRDSQGRANWRPPASPPGPSSLPASEKDSPHCSDITKMHAKPYYFN